MKKKIFISFLFCASFIQLKAQSDVFWSKHNGLADKIIEKDKAVSRQTFPKEFDLFDLNSNAIRQTLFSAINKSDNTKTIITLPNTDGKFEQFELFEASNFEPDLQARFPEIRAFSGKGITDKYATLKLSISPQGIQTMIFRTDKPNEFIEPYSKDHTIYAVFKSNRSKGSLAWTCATEEDKSFLKDVKKQLPTPVTNRSSDATLRTMRLAQSCNGEYSIYFANKIATGTTPTVAISLAAINATITRCNGVYEKDLALHLNLVSSSTNIIYLDPATDPYSTTLSQWNTQLQNAISTTLTGASTSLVANNAAYDIGHLFGATGGGGNAGCIGCVCVDAAAGGAGSTKGRGITSPSDGIPEGDNFDIDYVVHEVGHQLGGNHTFSNANEGAGVNVEIGSGVTIMGYAGITPYDVAPHSIDKYHAVTIAQIQANLIPKSCPVVNSISANNATPTVNAGLDYTIPISTSYILTAVGADANANDALTYSWEQKDDGGSNTGAASSASPTKTSGPNFISWNPTVSSSRYFPKIESIVANSAITNQVGGDAGMLSEALSSVSRVLNFRATIRDNAPYVSSGAIKVGQTNFDDMVLTVTSAAGPFTVTSPDTAVSWLAGTNQNVTWNVAGTSSNGVNASFVDIFLSTDGGFTYPIQLANKVPNDGSEIITVPNNIGSNNKIMVKGNNHVFFDISNSAFAITAPTATFAVTETSPQSLLSCSLTSATFTFDYKALAGFTGTTTFSATGVPSGATVNFNPTSLSSDGLVTLTINNLSGIGGNYNILVNASSSGIIKSVPFYLYLGLSNSTLNTPANNAISQPTSISLTWNSDPNATSYNVQLATDNLFTAIVSSANVSTTFYSVSGLIQGTNYFWRVLPKNATCTGTYGSPYKFTTAALTCGINAASTNVPITISASGAPTITSTLNVPSGGNIGDVNVNVNILHTYISDLTITLTSPSNTEVTLFSGSCTSNDNMNATFDDAGSALVCATSTGTTTYAVSGIITPVSLLSAFNGQNSTGTWTLKVIDGFNLDGGSLNNWSIDFCTVTPLGVEEKVFQDFALYPNPNNGNFNVKLTSNSNENIKVLVHDISGRQVYEKSFANSGIFNQDINLSTVQSGIYLITVGDGAKKIVKRIIIE